jgi:hypothetical protein
MTEWQHMDSAPKDDEDILLWNGVSSIAAWRGGGWHTREGCRIYNPTCWMPLPKASD